MQCRMLLPHLRKQVEVALVKASVITAAWCNFRGSSYLVEWHSQHCETLVLPIFDFHVPTRTIVSILFGCPLGRLETDSRIQLHMQALREYFSSVLHPAPPSSPLQPLTLSLLLSARADPRHDLPPAGLVHQSRPSRIRTITPPHYPFLTLPLSPFPFSGPHSSVSFFLFHQARTLIPSLGPPRARHR